MHFDKDENKIDNVVKLAMYFIQDECTCSDVHVISRQVNVQGDMELIPVAFYLPAITESKFVLTYSTD